MIRTRNANLSPTHRSEFILWIEQNSPRKDIVRFLNDGGIDILGGFSCIPPSINPGWIIRTTSKNNQVYNVAITLDTKRHWLHIWVVGRVPWENYIGKTKRGAWSVYDGDNPEHSQLQKARSIRNEGH